MIEKESRKNEIYWNYIVISLRNPEVSITGWVWKNESICLDVSEEYKICFQTLKIIFICLYYCRQNA